MPSDKEPKISADSLERVKQLIALIYSGAEDGVEQAKQELEQLKADNPDEDIDLALAEEAANNIASQREDLDEKQKRALKTFLATSAGLNLIKTGASIAQIVDANNKRGKVVIPKAPPLPRASAALSTELAEARALANQLDPKLRSLVEAQLAQERQIAASSAVATGNVGQALGNVQQAAITRARSIEGMADNLAANKRAEQGIVNQLLNTDLNERRFLATDRLRRFFADRGFAERSLNNIQAQRNSGLQNLFNTLEEVPTLASNAAGLTDTTSPATGDAEFERLSSGGVIEPINQLQPLTLPERQLPLADVLRMGSPTFRRENPDVMEDLRDQLRRQGIEVDETDTGLLNSFFSGFEKIRR